MKPPPFEFHRAHSALEASRLLAELGENAKLIAGGQSLVPMMNFRLAHPAALVDINALSDLDYIRREGDVLAVGALTRHRTVETSRDAAVHDGFGVLPRAARWIGHRPIRTRGTVGGSLAHADGAAEWCMLARLFDAQIRLLSTRGERLASIDTWFQGFLGNDAEPDEVVTEVRFRRPRAFGALSEFAQRAGDFAAAAAAVAFDLEQGRVTRLGLVLGGVSTEPLLVEEAAELADGESPSDSLFRRVAEVAVAAADTDTYRRHLISTLVQRALREALAAEETSRG
ncbi:FAD binding domain-containing protein [Nocardioides aquiterrae]|uniref:Xanthine dehydrogenase family protein subunit M n=1 Tax=Nocardioides aquiterrae TaxID=203799 RepID=A0ABN1UEL6_9ACTN